MKRLSKDVLEEILFNKELSDTLRDIVVNSAINLWDAYMCLLPSKDYDRDSFVIKELANTGVTKALIKRIIYMNNCY